MIAATDKPKTALVKLDPRRNKPSASSLDLYFRCNGAFNLIRQMPLEERERLSTKDAERGTRIHSGNETGDVLGMALKEADIVERARLQEERIFTNWADEYQITDAEIIRERRFWLRESGVDKLSGKVDFAAFSARKRHLLLLDLKSGRKEVPPPVSNWQLRGGVVLLAANYNIVHARVGIVQPLATAQALCDYNTENIFKSWAELDKLLERINNPEAPRTAGTHCEFCPARSHCPEATAVVSKFALLKGVTWASLTADKKLKLWESAKLVKKLAEAIERNVSAELEANPDAIPGLIKKPDTEARKVSDVTGVYGVLEQQFKFKPEQFTSLCSVTVGDLKEFYRNLSGASEAEADAWLNKACADFITTSPRKGAVEKVKEEKK